MGSEQEYLGFLAKQNWQIGQNYIPCVQRYSFRIKIFCSKKKQNFGSILRLWERIFRSLFATFGHGCQTRILRVQRPYWNKSGIGFIFNFSKFWRKLWFALKNSRFVKQDLTLQENNFLGKTKFSTNTALREEWTVVCRNMTGSFAANALHATIEAIWRKRLFFSHRNINFEYLFWLWTENVQNFLNFFAKGVKTELYVSRRTFWKKTYLQEVTFLYHFKVLLRTFWIDGKLHGRQEGILRDQLNVTRKNSWEKPKILELCEMSEKFQFFGETVLAELSKLHSVCPEKHFEENVLFLEKNMILNPFSDIGWKTSFFGYKFRQGCQNWIVRAQRRFWTIFRKQINSIFLSRIYWEKFELHKNSGFARKAFFVSSGTFRGNIF